MNEYLVAYLLTSTVTAPLGRLFFRLVMAEDELGAVQKIADERPQQVPIGVRRVGYEMGVALYPVIEAPPPPPVPRRPEYSLVFVRFLGDNGEVQF